MDRDVDALTRGTFDVVVVGGGINGTGVARDAARRGLKVALVEKNDWGYGTTSRSTRLIHGGIRYLELLDFGLVRESLRERKRLLMNAPHLVEPLEFLVPIYEDLTPGRLKMRAGLVLYDLLSWGKRLPRHGFLKRDAALETEPALRAEGLKGAAVYHDAQVPDVERLCVENVLDAVDHGAAAANHAEVVAVHQDPDHRVTGVRIRDHLTGHEHDVRCRVLVNATGPWVDGFLGLVSGDTRPRIRTTKGIHLVTPKVVDHAVVLFATDGRLFFAVPWKDRTLVGTTDTDYTGDMDAVAATDRDVEYLRESFHRFFPDVDLTDVHYTYAGVRSLLRVEGVDESDVSRKHLILDHGHVEDIPGLVSVIGGKITNHRQVGEEVGDLLAEALDVDAESGTANAPLPGAFEDHGGQRDAFVEGQAPHLSASYGVSEGTAKHLLRLYGTRAPRVLEHAGDEPELLEPLCEHGPTLWAEVAFAVDEEMARTTADVLLRRTTLGQDPCQGIHVAEHVARFLTERLQRDDAAEQRDLEAFHQEMSHREPDAGTTPAHDTA